MIRYTIKIPFQIPIKTQVFLSFVSIKSKLQSLEFAFKCATSLNKKGITLQIHKNKHS